MLEYEIDKSQRVEAPTKESIKQQRDRQLAVVKALRRQLMQIVYRR